MQRAVPGDDERRRVLELIGRYGWNATAFQTLETGYAYFFADEACVAYVDTGRAWVAAGAPIASEAALARTAEAVAAAARGAGRRACFFATEERFRRLTDGITSSLLIGEQPIWDPREWARTVARHRSLREQLRRARAKGVRVRRLEPAELGEPAVRAALPRLVDRWLARRGRPPMEFLVRIELFEFLEHRSCFVAELGERIVAFAGVVPVPARKGWFVEDLVRDPEAPNGTSELLVDAVMRWAAERDSGYLTLGLAPLAGNVPAPLRFARRSTRMLYDFGGLARYKAKLRPSSWSPIYLSYARGQNAVVSLVDALAAFAPGGFVRFGWRALVRGPSGLLRVLTVLLVPWTLALAAAPVDPWFGFAGVKWAWVVFDALLATALFRLLKRPTWELALVLSLAVTADAALTAVQALHWNLPQARGAFELAVTVVACAAPALAAIVLWGTTARLRKLRMLP